MGNGGGGLDPQGGYTAKLLRISSEGGVGMVGSGSGGWGDFR